VNKPADVDLQTLNYIYNILLWPRWSKVSLWQFRIFAVVFFSLAMWVFWTSCDHFGCPQFKPKITITQHKSHKHT